MFQLKIFLGHVADLFADGEGCGRAGRGSIENVNGAMALLDDKIVDQRTGRRHRLRADSGAAGDEVALANFRQ